MINCDCLQTTPGYRGSASAAAIPLNDVNNNFIYEGFKSLAVHNVFPNIFTPVEKARFKNLTPLQQTDIIRTLHGNCNLPALTAVMKVIKIAGYNNEYFYEQLYRTEQVCGNLLNLLIIASIDPLKLKERLPQFVELALVLEEAPENLKSFEDWSQIVEKEKIEFFRNWSQIIEKESQWKIIIESEWKTLWLLASFIQCSSSAPSLMIKLYSILSGMKTINWKNYPILSTCFLHLLNASNLKGVNVPHEVTEFLKKIKPTNSVPLLLHIPPNKPDWEILKTPFPPIPSYREEEIDAEEAEAIQLSFALTPKPFKEPSSIDSIFSDTEMNFSESESDSENEGSLGSDSNAVDEASSNFSSEPSDEKEPPQFL